ncbi:MAG: 5'-nucleotidase C-terminal domain-containing protein [Dysgonamonadaceae bacterium]|jgi:2',3'-cyclic-nucleotide 2'-phosphodiesterase (5'-nucleotidase family)|nr:5'-nucleotidase C-terminal domain-containing protein [Dysgonamonadaceae bacterium]
MKKIQTVALTLALISCTNYEIKEIQVSRISVDSSLNTPLNTPVQILIDSFKNIMDAKINEEIGVAEHYIPNGKPQSPLGNLTADAMLDFGNKTFKKIDFALTNIGGIRNTIDQGPITIGKMYEIFPFENKITIVEINGKSINKLFASIAEKGGEGLSKNVELIIKNNKTESLKINGKPIVDNKTYRILTSDYLAQGNDGMTALTEAINITESNTQIRDLMIEHIKRLTAENRKIKSTLDNRIKIK